MKDLQLLVYFVLKQMKQDIANGDTDAIVEMLVCVPRQNLIGYLPEETQVLFNNQVESK